MRNVIGITGAGPIWHDIMEYASRHYNFPPDDFTPPANVHKGTVSALSGLLPRPGEPTVTDWFIDGTMPTIQGPETVSILPMCQDNSEICQVINQTEPVAEPEAESEARITGLQTTGLWTTGLKSIGLWTTGLKSIGLKITNRRMTNRKAINPRTTVVRSNAPSQSEHHSHYHHHHSHHHYTRLELSLLSPSQDGSPHGTFLGKRTIPQQTSGEKRLSQAKKGRVTMDRRQESSQGSQPEKRTSQQWEIQPLDVSLPHQTRALDFIRMKACLSPKEHRPQRVEKVVSAINSKLKKMEELLQSSYFQDSLKNDIKKQMNAYVQDASQSYRQATKYNGYMGSQGKSDRERGEVKLTKLLGDIKQKVEAIDKMNELEINNINDLNEKIINQYREFNSMLRSKLDKKNGEMIIELFKRKQTMYSLHKDFIQSYTNTDFFEAAKLAKQFIFEKEAFESYLTDQSFRSHFLSLVKEQDLSQSDQAQLAKIDRKTPISKVPEQWRMAFAVARGHAITEKVNYLPDGDANTKNKFNSRYENKIGESEEKEEITVATWVKNQRFSRYINYIDTKNGIIRANHNFKDYDAKDGGGKPLPNSEILYNQLLAVLQDQQIDTFRFNLTQVIREKIDNSETQDTLNCCIEGKEPSASNLYEFAKGSEGYYAILGTPNAYGTLYLLKQHPSVFGKKEITCIEVKKHVEYGKPNLILHIGERE